MIVICVCNKKRLYRLVSLVVFFVIIESICDVYGKEGIFWFIYFIWLVREGIIFEKLFD